MRLRIKIALCVLLMIFACLSLMAVLSSLGVTAQSTPAAADASYELRSRDGFVAVFCPPGAEAPITLTEIRVQDLPLSDRQALAAGIPVEEYRDVVRMLEDYGS